MEDAEDSRLLPYLPGIYADDPFLAHFLRILEATWSPLERQIGQSHRYFDPRLTPSEFLPWLGTWVDLVLDQNWPEPRRRALILNAADLYRRRGTLNGLRDYLTIYMGIQPVISEDLGDSNPYHFAVTFRVPEPTQVDEDRVRRIIEEQKPAHTTYTLRLEKA